jgi:hypothetical protein
MNISGAKVRDAMILAACVAVVEGLVSWGMDELQKKVKRKPIPGKKR